MRPLQLPAPVEAERGLQGPGLALVEDRECVDHPAYLDGCDFAGFGIAITAGVVPAGERQANW